MTDRLDQVKSLIEDFPDFPKKGILFRDIFPVLRNPQVFRHLIDLLCEQVTANASEAKVIVGLESRGFLFGPMIAEKLQMAFAPIRKAGKLPGKCFSIPYSLEYGADKFEIQEAAVKPGDRVVIIDDLLATGGTMKAAVDLLGKLEAQVDLCLVAIELSELNGKSKLHKPFHSLIQY